MKRLSLCILAFSAATLLWVQPASALLVGISGEFHQDIEDQDLWPNDFHVEGRISSKNGPPVLSHHVDGPFPHFTYSVTPDTSTPEPDWYWVTADWWFPVGTEGIPYCTVIYLGVFFEVGDENVYVDLNGWWTLDGERVGGRSPLNNNGFAPVMGFEVKDFLPNESPIEGQHMTLANGNMIVPPSQARIPVQILQMDLVALPKGGLNALGDNWWEELQVNGMQAELPWVAVKAPNGQVISEGNPVEMAVDSFFDVFFEIEIPDTFGTVTQFAIEPGGFLVIRELVQFLNNNDIVESRWFFHLHGADDFPEACCLPDGSCVDISPWECERNMGTPMGMGTTCATVICEQGEVACCDADGQCHYMPAQECQDIGGYIPPGGVCLGDNNGNNVDDACEQEERKACCLPDGHCIDMVPDECLASGGWIPPGGICLGDGNGNNIDDACEDIIDEPCCLPDGQCIYIPPFECQELGGYYPAAGMCLGDGNGNNIDDACEDIPEEACCLPDGQCVYIPPFECERLGGYFPPAGMCLGDGNGNNIDDACEDIELQACCLDDGVCIDNMDPIVCRQQNGTPQGAGSMCAGVVTGCCLPDGSCISVDALCCDDMGGTSFAGFCAAQEQACCLDDGSCIMADPNCCRDMGGVPQGLGSICTQPIACCFDDGSCMDLDPLCCEDLGGSPSPIGATMCMGDTNGNNIDDACEEIPEDPCCLPDGSCVYIPLDECHDQGGYVPGIGMCLGDANGNNIDDACETIEDFVLEFSLDIGSDTELSDPNRDGDEGFDPGDVYLWNSAPVVFPGRDGFKDDEFLFQYDPWPAAPDATYATAAPIGSGGYQNYWEYFDLDAHDQLDVFLLDEFIPPEHPLEMPIPEFDSQCIYPAKHLLLSFDDDKGRGWTGFDVPVTAPSPAGVVSYGSTAGRDEVIGITLDLAPFVPPFPIMAMYPFADEIGVHPSLAPNADSADGEDDDDVDSLDAVISPDTCPFWYFSFDSEGHLGYDPGHIYAPGFGGPVVVVHKVIHLGLPEDVDIDAFEFVWMTLEDGQQVLAILFSVDDDDPITPWDESGGLPPNVIFYSLMTGWSMEATEPLHDDVDALTTWKETLESTEACCFPDGSCMDLPPAQCIQMNGRAKGPGTDCATTYCPPCPYDLDWSWFVGTGDINLIKANYGPVTPATAPYDLDGSGFVGTGDINLIKANYGPCP